ncbi:MAG: hypothetical protein FJ119_00410 [Deltaproteobacteria bacterium]|nr:hypothetical protein [Deltaproteobacteria bacterium]
MPVDKQPLDASRCSADRPGSLPFHPVDLCQPDTMKSCAACCGLYNWQDHSRTAITGIVSMQTDLFSALDSYDNLDEYRLRRDQRINNTKLFETIYNCEFVGFVDRERRRVGCLLHPSVTGIPALRNHCFYGAKICHEHFCPGYGCLTTPEQLAVVSAVQDWYLFGLVITDIDLVKEFFRHVENALGESIKPARLSQPELRHILHDFFSLKEHWQFKAAENRLGKYYFSASEYAIARIDYCARWGVPESRFDKILVSLESEFSSYEQVLSAEEMLQEKIHAFIRAYSAAH